MERDALIAYKMYERDISRLCEYVHPTEQNYAVYSHRIYELFFRLCAELENLFKQKISSINAERGVYHSGESIEHYHILENEWKLSQLSVGLMFTIEEGKFFRPFENWSKTHAITWWQAYNKVKHNRLQNLHKANLENLFHSFSAVCLVCFCSFGSKFFLGGTGATGVLGGSGKENRMDMTWSGCPIIIRVPNELSHLYPHS